MWTKEDMMKLPQEKLPAIGSDKIYNDLIKIEEDWKNDEATKPHIDLLNTSLRSDAEKYWRTVDESHLEAQMDRVNVLHDIVEKFKQK